MKNKTVIIKDIVNSFVSIPKGLWITLVNWSIFRPCVTELYPEQRPNLPENYRGIPVLPVDPKTGKSRCIACGACVRMCPEQIITVEMDKSDPKDRKPSEFSIDISRCMWCGLCTEACPVNCLVMGKDFELATYTREGMIYNLEDLMRLGGEFPAEEVVEEVAEEKKEESDS